VTKEYKEKHEALERLLVSSVPAPSSLLIPAGVPGIPPHSHRNSSHPHRIPRNILRPPHHDIIASPKTPSQLVVSSRPFSLHNTNPISLHLSREFSFFLSPPTYLIPHKQVEHESSVIGAKSIGTLAAISACLIYLIFRYWISSSRASSTTKYTTTTLSSTAHNAARAILS